MHVFLNGEWVADGQAVVSVHDRGFLYGDGLFETVLVCQGRLFRWTQHLERLRKGASFLGIHPPLADAELTQAAEELLRRNHLTEGLLRLTVTRGVGPRGYSTRGADRPTILMTTHAATAGRMSPPRWRLAVSSLRVAAGDPLLTLKTANKLLNVLARAEAEARDADEALLVNTDGHLVEAAAGNLFWIEHGTVCTAPLDAGLLEGVTRGLVLEICRGLNLPVVFKRITPADLFTADGVFLTLSSLGIVEATTLDGRPLPCSPLTTRLAESFRLQILAEC